jgi:integrase
VRVKLTGIASATKVLASGEKVTYYYAWRGGPGLKGEPDSPEFILSYEQAHRERHTPDSSVLKAIIADYLASKQFDGLRDRTKADYLKQIAKIERTFGDLPLAALEDPKVTKEFLRWRDRIGGRKQADYAFTVLMLVLAHGRKVGMTGYRPPGRIEKLYHADRSNKIWEDHNVAAFMAVAAEQLQWALIFAAETGQRQGDLLRLKWSAYDGHWIKLTPSKSITRRKPSGRPVEIPVSSRLQALIKKLPRLSPIMLTNGRGRPWQGNSFRKAWGAASTKAGIVGLTFHDLRGTAVTRMSEAGCSPQEIATFTGWSLRDVQAILDRYLARTTKLAATALEKWERVRK